MWVCAMALTEEKARGGAMDPFSLMGRENCLEIQEVLRYLHVLYMSGNDEFSLHHFVMFLR